jgi:hypothetical protein
MRSEENSPKQPFLSPSPLSPSLPHPPLLPRTSAPSAPQIQPINPIHRMIKVSAPPLRYGQKLVPNMYGTMVVSLVTGEWYDVRSYTASFYGQLEILLQPYKESQASRDPSLHPTLPDPSCYSVERFPLACITDF